MFNPQDYITVIDADKIVCRNPIADGGLCSITINRHMNARGKAALSESIKRMVLTKLFSPKFAEVILTAIEKEYGYITELKVA
jgi:predicted ABC-type ATPase